MSRRTAATIVRGRPHLPVDDPDAPGTCATCHRPTGVPNDRHVQELAYTCDGCHTSHWFTLYGTPTQDQP